MVSNLVQKLIAKFQEAKELEEKAKNRPEATNIHVDEIARRLAAIYEKIRKVVDWREEHLMRRVAIKRILKRRKLLSKSDNAEDFVIELIRGSLFLNDRIERNKIKEVKKILDKYSKILQIAKPLIADKKSLFWSEVLDVASCEIQDYCRN